MHFSTFLYELLTFKAGQKCLSHSKFRKNMYFFSFSVYNLNVATACEYFICYKINILWFFTRFKHLQIMRILYSICYLLLRSCNTRYHYTRHERITCQKKVWKRIILESDRYCSKRLVLQAWNENHSKLY